ncbi:MAG TPA: hypothetical protein VFS60_07475 [Thermoanaerobaculia bacterium]|nr:hypothetical protein [Thermoanaerobaculia bacterium]
MHRSGTSLAASVLGRAGLDLGSRLNGPGPGNRRGHFEDVEIWRLHEEMLAAAGHTAFSAGDDFAPPLGNGFVTRAKALVAARAGQRAWGWKDPRTCLFLDLWEPLVPGAGWLFLYRHPVDVVLSLLRRNTDPDLSRDPQLAFESWAVHNRRMLAFVERYRERCFLAQTPALAADLGGFVARVGERFALPLEPAGAAELLVTGELASSVPERERLPWARVIVEALELYARLEEIADLPGGPAPADEAEGEAEPQSTAAQARTRPELRLSEALLYDLLEVRTLRRQQRATAEAFARALDDERAQADAARHLEAAARHREAVARNEEAGWRHREAVARNEEANARHREAAVREELRRGEMRASELEHRLAEMEARWRDAASRREELAAALSAVERSRSFRLVSSWWRLASARRGG